ncbi:MAG: alkaline phosphatase PhoX, partial [Nodosilinea sp.]
MPYSRRNFLKIAGASAVGATMVAPLEAFYARIAQGQVATGTGFGALEPKLPLNKNYLVNNPYGDLSSTPLLDLPPGFNYKILSATGQQMPGGGIIPGDHDGMAAFPGPRNTTILVRNHELSPFEAKFGYTEGVAAPSSKRYSTGATGGTTTLVVGSNREVVKEFGSLSGTIRNCAGGPTPWGSWVSCEETFESTLGGTKRHGYNFEVPATAEPAFADPIPLVEMGRFSHEAIAVDPNTGYVYETEDRGDSCFYRFVPKVGKPTKAGDLAKGGTLYALRVKGRPTLNTTNNPNLPSPGLGGAIGTVPVGAVLD